MERITGRLQQKSCIFVASYLFFLVYHIPICKAEPQENKPNTTPTVSLNMLSNADHLAATGRIGQAYAAYASLSQQLPEATVRKMVMAQLLELSEEGFVTSSPIAMNGHSGYTDMVQTLLAIDRDDPQDPLPIPPGADRDGPENIRKNFARAMHAESMGRFVQAKALYSQIIARRPDFIAPHLRLAKLLHQEGAYIQAAMLISQIESKSRMKTRANRFLFPGKEEKSAKKNEIGKNNVDDLP